MDQVSTTRDYETRGSRAPRIPGGVDRFWRLARRHLTDWLLPRNTLTLNVSCTSVQYTHVIAPLTIVPYHLHGPVINYP